MKRPLKENCKQYRLSIYDLSVKIFETDSMVHSLEVEHQPSHSREPNSTHWLGPLIRDRFHGSISVPWDRLYLDQLTEFQLDVLTSLDEVPAGSTITYGQLATRIGRPKASRAVGQTLQQNPYPILLPCHRVIRSDGTAGGYAGEPDSTLKQHLLSLEEQGLVAPSRE